MSARAPASLAPPTAEQWRRIFLLLDTALELEPMAHAGWLADLDVEDAPLAPWLGQLLRTHASGEADRLLGACVAGPADTPGPNTRVGPYRLLREIGQGGMATVWLADRADGLLDRKVALKLPHASWGSSALSERMSRERSILASLTHQGIARLYDAGVAADGRPWLALEHVDGQPIDTWATARGLSVRERVDLVLQVARAVAYAHTRLVVHGDLKPSNILVDVEGRAHLLDFGVAKLLDAGEATARPSHATVVSGRALTPDYASPEQVRGDPIGTTSDVYSLGVVAYELLAGTRPYRLGYGLGAAALAEAMARVAVPRASGIAVESVVRRQLAGDLDAILARALAKESAERYATVDALADDLERHLRGEPVQARPDGWPYHVGRWVRRHKLETVVVAAIVVAVPAGAIAQAAVLVAIGVGAGVALWQMRVAQRQTVAARREAGHAEEVKAFVLSIFHAAGTDEGAGAATTAVEVLQSARKRIDAELSGRPETAVELMTAIGQGLYGLGALQDAEAVLGQCVALGARELGLRHRHMPQACVTHAAVLLELDRPQEALALLGPAIAEARRLQRAGVLAEGLRRMASAQLRTGRTDDALASAREAVQVLDDAAAAGTPADPRDAMAAWVGLANALNVAQRPGIADAARRALVHARSVHGDRFTEATLSVRMMLAKGLSAEGQYGQALAELDLLLGETVRFFGSTYPRLESLHNFRGHVRFDSGDTAGAIEAFSDQLAFAEQRGGAPGANLGLAHGAVARVLAAHHAFDAALLHRDAGIGVLQAALGEDNPHVLRARSARILLLARLGRLEEAERDALALESMVEGFDDIDRGLHAGHIGTLRSAQGRHEEATRSWRASVEALSTQPSTLLKAVASAGLGSTWLAAGRAAEAIEPLREAVRLFADKRLAVSPDHAAAAAALERGETMLQGR